MDATATNPPVVQFRIEDPDVMTKLADAHFRMGTQWYYAGMGLSIPLDLRGQPEMIEAFVRGFQRGQDEAEVNEAAEAWERLPIDQEPERSVR